ncbi:MAG: ribosome biogenesis GTPase Der [Deltaproteobacteria bacterium]|jgi:GTP-binding protein|nr:ribosome biogenesis GTPase Der [Deltaproteobacteria bacterium]
MSSLIALVGRPNVGKSSLFNRLLRRSAALVDDRPGVTRDRHYAPLVIEGRSGLLVDTGGFDFSDLDPLAGPVTSQIMAAMDESDLVVLVTDGLLGLHPQDVELARLLRRSNRPCVVCVNKIDGPNKAPAAAEFHAVGLSPVLAVSAAHGYGLSDLRDFLAQYLDPCEDSRPLEAPPRVALIGRPNAGKSSIINRLLGSERLVVNDLPGTTRDAIDVEIQIGDHKYVLVDTAGVRRKGRVSEKLEKLSVMRAIKGIERSDIAVLVIDALEGVADQDAHIAGYAFERGRPLIVLVNKWDAVSDRLDKRRDLKREMELKMVFLAKAPFMTVSALTGAGLSRLWPFIDRLMAQYCFRATTGQVNRVIEKATEAHTPPQVGRTRLKFYYATQVSSRPPTFVLFVNRPEAVHFSYRRFLANRLRLAFGLDLVPVKLVLRDRHQDERVSSGSKNKSATALPASGLPTSGLPATPNQGRPVSDNEGEFYGNEPDLFVDDESLALTEDNAENSVAPKTSAKTGIKPKTNRAPKASGKSEKGSQKGSDISSRAKTGRSGQEKSKTYAKPEKGARKGPEKGPKNVSKSKTGRSSPAKTKKPPKKSAQGVVR